MQLSMLPLLTVAVVLAVTATPWPASINPGFGLPPAPITPYPLGGPVHALTSLVVGSVVGTHYASPFYAISYGESGISPTIHSRQGIFYNSTPIAWYRLGGGGDGYDPTIDTNFVAPPNGSGPYVAQYGQLVNYTAFEAWCYSRIPHCQWMSYLPAEENNTTAAVHVAEWYHRVLGFAPTLWQFGNEPTAWTHYGINETQWSTSDDSTPTNEDYAIMVKDYIAAVSAVFPHDRFVGLEAACACNATFPNAVATVDGAKIVAMAYHEFPSVGASPSNLAQYFSPLYGHANIYNTSTEFRAAESGACRTCAQLPVQIGAYQAGPSGNLTNLTQTYAGAPFAAASVIQALESNISMFTLFESNNLFNATAGVIYPQGYLYQRVLENMTMGTDYPVNFTVHSVGGLFGILIKNGTRESMLLVNTNTTFAVGVGLTSLVFPVGLSGTSYTWSPTTPTPIAHTSVLIPKYLVLPPEGITLLNNF